MPRTTIYLYYRLQHFREFAAKLGGECLSDKYINSATNMNWKCSKGHVFGMSANRVAGGAWCRICKPHNYHGKEYKELFDRAEAVLRRKKIETLAVDRKNGRQLLIQCEHGRTRWIHLNRILAVKFNGFCRTKRQIKKRTIAKPWKPRRRDFLNERRARAYLQDNRTNAEALRDLLDSWKKAG